jgi:cell division protease FtsH
MAETLLEKEVINHHDIRELLGDRPKGNYPEGIFDENGSTIKKGTDDEVVSDTSKSKSEETNDELTDAGESSENDETPSTEMADDGQNKNGAHHSDKDEPEEQAEKKQ